VNKNGTLNEHKATESALDEQSGGSHYLKNTIQERKMAKQMKNDMTRLFIMQNWERNYCKL
jgi:hypothetical protein